MTQNLDLRLKFLHERAISIWEKFCILHRDLYDLTSKEYLILLEGQIEPLEQLIQEKDAIIQNVNLVEAEREELINEINSNLEEDKKILKAFELISFFKSNSQNDPFNSLTKLNELLIDIIEKLQSQNKKNQQYLNKAMLSVKELQNNFRGKKNYTTYGSDGLTRSIVK
jgi:flagellar biosynthesis/type III secretory pathway chaperone